MSLDRVEDLIAAAEAGEAPPPELPDLLRAMWLARQDRWHEAHEIAQEVPSAMGSWVHAHLHLLEGDLGNAGYWYSRAGKPPRQRGEEDEGWREIAAALLQGE